jgi:VanZ family protein
MKRLSKQKLMAWSAVAGWMLMIFVLSGIPGSALPKVPWKAACHRVAHFVEYSVLAVLFLRALGLSFPPRNRVLLAILALALTFVFACSDEWHQTFTAGRTGCLEDVGRDMLYAAAGIVFYWFYNQLSSNNRSA